MVDIETKLTKTKGQKIVSRDMRKLRSNPGKFIEELQKIDWSFINDHQEDVAVDLLEEYFTKNVIQVLDKLAEFKTRNLGKRRKKSKSEKLLNAEKNWLSSYKRWRRIKPLARLTKILLLHIGNTRITAVG